MRQKISPFFFPASQREMLTSLPVTHEIICVHDGRRDNILQLLIEYHRKDPPIKVINLSRNFGKEIAMTAGLDYATGKAVIPIDADLQDPPELIVPLVAKWREGYDIVNATPKSGKGESWWQRKTAEWFHAVISKISNTPIQ